MQKGDICQEVCPFNQRRASPPSEPAFQPRHSLKDLKDLKDLLYLTQVEFSAVLKGSAVKRAKRRGLLRNAIAALAGRDDREAAAALEHALSDPEESVREAAGWTRDDVPTTMKTWDSCAALWAAAHSCWGRASPNQTTPGRNIPPH